LKMPIRRRRPMGSFISIAFKFEEREEERGEFRNMPPSNTLFGGIKKSLKKNKPLRARRGRESKTKVKTLYANSHRGKSGRKGSDWVGGPEERGEMLSDELCSSI